MTVLDGVESDHVTRAPFPHLILKNAVDADLCNRLIDEFPALPVFTGGKEVGDNVKIYYPAHLACADDRVSDVWKAFLRAHLTADFYLQAVQVFRPFLLEEYPDLERSVGKKLESFQVGISGQDNFDTCDALLGSLIGIHTPVSGATHLERRPHVKNCDKFLEGFLYLQDNDDSASGGDYEFFSVKSGAHPKFGKWAQTDRQNLHLERTVPYGKNTLVILLNTSRSIQALTPRGPGKHPLMYCNFTIQLPNRLFDLNYSTFGRTHRFLRHHLDKITHA